MKKIISLTQKKLLESEKKKDVNRRFFNRNIEAMRFCNNNGFTIYATAQAGSISMVKIFKQKGEKFLPLTETLFDQSKPEDVENYIALIDIEYERIYNKMKNKVL